MRGRVKLLSGIVAILLAAASGFLLGRGRVPRPSDATSGRRVLYWIDPMHPAYKSDHPGTAPDCGMPLEPVYADSLIGANASSAPDLAGEFDGEIGNQRMSNIGVVRVERASQMQKLQIPGRVVADETRVYNVNAGVDGFVKETHQDAVGNFVRKDQRLATIYSPEFLTVLGGYLSATERSQNTVSKEGLAATQGITGVQNWADRLRNLGVSDAQIAEVKVTRKIPEDIYVVSPVDGFILSRNIAGNQRFERHTEFYRIADLSHVWVTANVFAEESAYFRPGLVVSVVVPDLGGTFSARVSSALPQVDPTTRIVTLRLEAENPHFAMRPEMFVNVDLPVHAPAGLMLPREAVLDSGVEKRVFVEVANGTFQAREVKTGRRFDDRVEIVGGLEEGERVAAAASFVVDSEAKLKTLAPPIADDQPTPNRRSSVASAGRIASAHATHNSNLAKEHQLAFSGTGGRP